MNRLSQVVVISIVIVTGATAWAQAQTSSGPSRSLQDQQGSQLLPEARAPFSPAPDTVAPAKPGQAAAKSTADRSSPAMEGVGVGSDSPVRPAQCDFQRCAGIYHSFRASDCTYQPYTGGPRRICER